MSSPCEKDGDAVAVAVGAKYNSLSNKEIFNWWLRNREIAISPTVPFRSEDHRLSESSASISSRIDSDDSDTFTFAQDVSKQKQESEICEKIELNTITRDNLDVYSIGREAKETSDSAPTTGNGEFDRNVREEREFEAVSYTPERPIRSHKYRIPSSFRCNFCQTIFEDPWKSCRCRKRSNSLIDSEQFGAKQLRALLKLPTANTQKYAISSSSVSFATEHSESLLVDRDGQRVRDTKMIDDRSSDDMLNSTWKDCEGPDIGRYSLDVSSIQSNDGSSDMSNDTLSTHACPSIESAIASTDCTANFTNERSIVVNEVTSILENLHYDPGKAMVLLEEDRFNDFASSHDQLTRLALAIESDVEVPATLHDPDDSIRHLRDKIKRLQHANTEINNDICLLHTDFKREEKKINNLSRDTTRLRQEIQQLRYLDDLLKLLRGELQGISRRNWPFVLGHSGPRGEMNLII